MAKPKGERRKQPRAKAVPGLKVGVKPDLTGVQVKDISLSGLCFRLNRPMEFMARLLMTLIFPNRSDPDCQSETPNSVQCEGAVVRCEPVYDSKENQYEVAVFFTRLNDTARKAIEEYVKTQL